MNKNELRDKLFNEFEKVDQGILITNFLDETKVIRKKWYELKNIINQDKDEDLYQKYPNIVKFINYNYVNYLVISFRHYSYLIIDIDNKKVLNNNDVNDTFNQDFFVKYLNEIPVNSEKDFKIILSIEFYNNDIDKLINYVSDNKKYFDIKPNIFYEVHVGDAESIININLHKPNSILMFLTENQYLYEHLFMDENLNPLSMQDAVSRIGIDKMNEYFKRIRNIKIPIDIIDKNILNLMSKKNKKLLLTVGDKK